MSNPFGKFLESFLGDGGNSHQRSDSFNVKPSINEKLKSIERDSKTGERDLTRHVAALQDRVGKQALVIQTLLALAIDKGLFDAVEFRELLIELDLADGVRDGKVKQDKGAVICPSCDRVNSYRAVVCAYCEVELGQGLSI